MTSINLIYAKSTNNVIGVDGKMPWHIPEDLAHFKATTNGCPVIMGRKTWDSLPAKLRPLPGRYNIVITRNREWTAPGALVAHSLSEALQYCINAPDTWIIGGAEIYLLALPWADTVVVTEVDITCAGDALAPPLSPEYWEETSRVMHTSTSGLRYDIVKYEWLMSK